MKFIKWKILAVTCAVCLLSCMFGVVAWNSLPDAVAIHFNIYNEPDNFASKGFAVFALPCLMALLQIISCLINDINAAKHGERKKFETATKWIIPVMTTVLQIITLGYALGWGIDIRKSVALIIGVVFLVIGNYLPKFDYIKDYDIDTEKARKINRFIGIKSVVMGILMLVTIALPPITTVVWLFLLIPYAIISIVYAVKVIRSK